MPIDLNKIITNTFEHKLNVSRIINNPKLNIFIVLNIVLFIGCYNMLNNNTRNAILTVISYPLVLFILIAFALVLSSYNMMLGVLMLLTLFIILYPSFNIDSRNNKNNNIIGKKTMEENNNSQIIEGFVSERRKKRQQKEEDRDEAKGHVPRTKK